tara:strand:+ start:301 stop:681 length:381 start_codon:yes stop_codon:yes gene_type:complete
MPSKNQIYELRASLKATFIQNCIITLDPIKTKIEREVNLLFYEQKLERRKKNISIDIDTLDMEPIQKELNIGDAMLEVLSLEVPLYPKKENLDFDGVTATASGLKPLDRTSDNPFISLEKLRKGIN